jgi:hypothetical protein
VAVTQLFFSLYSLASHWLGTVNIRKWEVLRLSLLMAYCGCLSISVGEKYFCKISNYSSTGVNTLLYAISWALAVMFHAHSYSYFGTCVYVVGCWKVQASNMYEKGMSTCWYIGWKENLMLYAWSPPPPQYLIWPIKLLLFPFSPSCK